MTSIVASFPDTGGVVVASSAEIVIVTSSLAAPAKTRNTQPAVITAITHGFLNSKSQSQSGMDRKWYPAQFTCDHCRSAITSGTRYHCLSGCNDFDLCQSCYNMRPNVGMHNSSHAMKAVSEPGSFPINVIPGGYPSPSPFPVAAPAMAAAPGVSVGFNPSGISINISTGPAVPPPQMSVGIAPQTSPYGGQKMGVMPTGYSGVGFPGPAVPPPAQSSMYPNYPQPSYPQPGLPQPSVGYMGGQASVTSYGPTQPSSSAYPPSLGGSSMQPPSFGGSSGMYPSTLGGQGPVQPSYPAPQPAGSATVTSYGYTQPGGAVVTSQGPTPPYNSFVMTPTPPGSAVITSMGPTNPPGSF
eukprot:TRINITY_DN3722_c0_g1_i1.p2 TRINITY_DN3722_c0_g1~~TRINITY_DN3722_c0_g1_i1.p2  ORF type:complete len:355 (-),score=51.10 TRINITY_DN3722_c0_g1_i1:58-1122(-)